jgi:hypothetical protein
MRIKSICKENTFIDNRLGSYHTMIHSHLEIGKMYEFIIDEDGVNLIMDGITRTGSGYVFFTEYPVYYEYDYKRFFMSKEEMRNANIEEILK